MATIPNPATPHDRDDGELAIVAGGGALSGWEDVAVTLRAQAFPNSFEIACSTPTGPLPAGAGDACSITIGGDTVVTGFVDSLSVSSGPTSHQIKLSGRGKTQDLADCSAEWPSGQLLEGTVKQTIEKLAQPYGIAVVVADGADASVSIPTLQLNYGETAGELVQRYARFAGLLAYEDPRGRLILGKAGTEAMASGVALGVNIENLAVTNRVDQCFSEITTTRYSIDTLIDLGPGGLVVDTQPDPNVKRHRVLYLVMDTGPNGEDFSKKRALWEAARRRGMALQVAATVDSWRDSAGKLWMPNKLIPVQIPGVPSQMAIAEVTFRRSNNGGTQADLTLISPDAYKPEPVQLLQGNVIDIAGPAGSQ